MRPRILVGLSGGVDSLSAALLLRERSCHVMGLYIRMHEQDEDIAELSECCSRYGIELHTSDMSALFTETVVRYFDDSYLNAKTPNICTVCNRFVKIPALISKAEELHCDAIATGHYAKVVQRNGYLTLSIAEDEWKDQSYMLYRLTQQQLSRLMLPLGEKTKEEIKRYAVQKGLDAFASKRESFGLCFTSGKHYTEYLLDKYPCLALLDGGKAVDKNLLVAGTHKGFPFYTVGQWKGLNTAGKCYVNEIMPQTNMLKVGDKSECFRLHIRIGDMNFIRPLSLVDTSLEYTAKTRGKDKEHAMRFAGLDSEYADIVFFEPVFAPMSGQDVVVYDGSRCLVLGGTIV